MTHVPDNAYGDLFNRRNALLQAIEEAMDIYTSDEDDMETVARLMYGRLGLALSKECAADEDRL